MWKQITNWLSGGAGGPITEYADLHRGGADVEGAVHADDLLISPINNRECVCFYYTSRFSSSRALRFSQTSARPLRHAMVYAKSMFMDLDGGRVLLEPKSQEDFAADDHAALTKAGIQGFKASEQLIEDGARVRAHGKLSQTDDGWRMKFDYLTIIGEDQPKGDEPEEEPLADDI